MVWQAELIPVLKKVQISIYNEMVIRLSQRFSCMLNLFIFWHFFISFKYDFHVDAESMITVKTREMQRNICVDGLKNNVWHDTLVI